ncbi:membrane-bound PQQ-dependent dehydrogenase, glucose/quinate/shikimate family [Martelella endophytica]|uniref:Glucose dehydrogenase n=1 Tax=Martelella endophytica TaxID=1486262 RepID=A0A0D5LPA4_MAREN|nr:membrane-bound PQQ-dependent dehydrogenase, glucose/quinate/shikimate family [Martelella endophytica]AJY45946.1 glucose dehydrogenase [Martelella endophytica]
MTDQPGRARRTTSLGAAGWWSRIFALILILIGIVLTAGGVWLIALGGSWYYAVAGIALLYSGFGFWQIRMKGFYVYLATWALTLVWAFWEVGFSGWDLVPRVVAPTVLLIGSLFTLPALSRTPEPHSEMTPAMSLVGAFAMAGLALFLMQGMAHAATGDTAVASPDKSAVKGTGTMVSTSAEGVNVRRSGADWPYYGGSRDATRYSPLDQINVDNVKNLKEVWHFHTGDMPDKDAKGSYSPENTPLKVGSHVYVCSAKDELISLDAGTGKEEWRYDPKVPDDAVPYGATCRGVAYYQVPTMSADAPCAERIIIGTLDARLIAIDAEHGRLCEDFGDKGMVYLEKGLGKTVPGWYAITAPPTIVRGVIVVGAQVKDGQAENAPSGVIRGYSAENGKLAWAWDMGAPDRTGAPTDGETYTRGTPNMWTAATADPELGYVYLPLGNSSVDYYGGNRKPYENEYNSSLVAIDVTTGKPGWHFQTVHYDLWDYDLGSQVSLVDMKTDNGTVPALVLPSKQGQIYVLNRKTGESLFPVEERPVPSGGVEPDNLAKTQPYSGYAHLDQPKLTARDMWGMSPIDQLWCRIQFRRAHYDGEYTAPTADKPYIEYPGYNGGSDWGSVAIDPKDRILVANYNDMPNFNQLIPREKADEMGLKPINEGGERKSAEGKGDPQTGSPYAINVNAGWQMPTGMLCSAPPYGHIRAIDLDTGKTLWDEPFGSAVNNGPFGIPTHLPLTIGTPNNGGPLVTAGGLIFIAATTDNKFRAIDLKTGKVVWETDLPAGGQANPMTYEENGRQFVVLAPGGHHFMKTKVGDDVIAWALPDQG